MLVTRSGAGVGLVVLVAAVALTLALRAPSAQTAAPAAPTATPGVLVVGDSLAVGTRPFLDELLPGRHVIWDIRGGRTTPQGMRRLRIALRVLTPQAIVLSLGTNDGPSPSRFTSRVRRLLATVPLDACVIWHNVVRPRRKGAYRGLNRALAAAALEDPRLVVLDWEGAVSTSEVVLPDGLHADAEGYRYRSAMIADAVLSGCPVG